MAKNKKSRMPVESPCEVARCTADDKARQRQYEIEDAARTLQRAGEIASDPKLLKEAKAFSKKQASMVDRIK